MPFSCLRPLSFSTALVAALLACSHSGVGHAQIAPPSAAGATYAYGKGVRVYGVNADWNVFPVIEAVARYGFQTRLLTQLAYWEGLDRPTEHRSLYDVSATPILRWNAPAMGAVQLFIEGGVGIRLLTERRINNDRDLGGSFQFGEQIGLGLAFGSSGRYEAGAYLQHISNARLEAPNDGISFVGAIVRARFD